MVIDIVTIFPAMIEASLGEGVIARARTKGVVDIRARDLREFTDDRHRTVDDQSYGGGPGMVMKAEPFVRAVEAIAAERGAPSAVVLMSPQGQLLTHRLAEALSRAERVIVLCGRYEGVDERVAETVVTHEVSIGDYVLTGGELPALVLIDAVTRLVPGVVGEAESIVGESFVARWLDHPHYTRPASFRGREVPAVLLSGNHAEIDEWRRRERMRRTKARRPDLIDETALSDQERRELKAMDVESGAPGLKSEG
jgi:tRNA (guanine37-N1)-methyltransferase